MTIKAIASQLGVSVPTLYRRLKTLGINIADLRDEKTGKITPAGAAVIADVFRGAGDSAAIQDILNGDAQRISDDTSTRDVDATVQAAVNAARLEAAELIIKRLEDELTRIRDERDKLLAMLEIEQRQRVQLLDGARQRRGLFGWGRGRGSGREE